MASNDYYKTLSVKREASGEEIRRSYKKLVRKYHPDAKPDDKAAAEKFKQVQEAYAVLGDSEKREQYDRYGTTFTGGGPQGQPANWSTGGQGPIDLNDILGGKFNFGDLFGGAMGGGPRGFGGAGAQSATRPRKGQDHRVEIQVPFHVAAVGGEHTLQIQQAGQSERLNIKIPPGVSSGSVIRLAGQGEPGIQGGPAGDLLLSVQVAAHPFFRREGKDLILDVPITPAEAAIGAKVEVPTLSEGHVTVTVPPGTSSGTKLRLRGKGVLDQKTKQHGDQFVVIKIVVPKILDDEALELYRQLAEQEQESPRTGLW